MSFKKSDRAYEIARTAWMAQDYLKALKFSEEALRVSDRNDAARRLAIAATFHLGRFADSLEFLRVHCAELPGDERTKVAISAIHCERGDYLAALDSLDSVDTTALGSVDRAMWKNNRAFALVRLGRVDEAAALSAQALAECDEGGRPFAERTAADVAIAVSEFARAVTLLRTALTRKLRPADVADVKLRLATALLSSGQRVEAVSHLRTVSRGSSARAEEAKRQLLELGEEP